MNNEKLIAKLEEIANETKNIKTTDDYNREVLIHLHNGQTAFTTLGLFYADFQEHKIVGRLNGKIEKFDFSEVKTCYIN